MAAKFIGTGSKRALIALAFPLAALVPLAVPFDALVGATGQAEAATVRKAKRKVVVASKVPVARKACTTTKIKGRKITKCKTVRVVPVQPVAVTAIAPVAPLPIAVFSPPAPPPMPMAPRLDPRPISPVDYYWIDQADSYAQALGNSPPDFTFNCDGVDCWAWLSRAGEVLIIEPGRDGARQYFYAPRQTSPYLVRDSYSSFAFDGRDLVQVYDSQGRLYTGLTSQARYDGEALQQRGRALYSASLRQRRWDRGSATAWIGGTSSLGYYDGWNSGWNGSWRELPEWDRYDRDHRRQHPPRHLDDEHRDRDDARRRYDDWHRRGDQGAPPLTGNPVVTPGDTGGTAPPPPRGPRPDPRPAPPLPAPPPLAEPQPPVTAAPPPVPSDAPAPRRERPRREIEDEPGLPPIPQRRSSPPPEQPVTQVQAAPPPLPMPAPVPTPAPAPEPAYVPPPPPAPVPFPEPFYTPPPAPEPAPAPQWQPAPVPAPAPAPPPPSPPPPPPPPPPPREQIQTENPPSDTDRP